MKNFPFSFDQLHTFSESLPYDSIPAQYHQLFKKLNEYKKRLNFPAISNDIGSFISFLFATGQLKTVFEFGSGYGHSAFWYFLGYPDLKNVTLTEKREDLEEVFEKLPWPILWREKINYIQGDAFSAFDNIEKIDFVLIDGVKATYLDFLKKCEVKLSKNGMVLIDNSFWRGSFLDDELSSSKVSAQGIRDLHEYIKSSDFWHAVFIPYKDGVTLLRKKC